MSNRKYEPNEKHKHPKGFGSLCPHPFDLHDAQTLLDNAVDGSGKKLWAAQGRWCFCAHPTRIEEGTWHGFPVIGGDVPERILRALEDAGHITKRERKTLRRQRELPEEWP